MKKPRISLKLLKIEAQKEIKKAPDLKGLNDIFNKYLGKRGELTRILRSLEKLPKGKRARIGSKVNKLKDFLKIKFDQRAEEIKEKIKKETEIKEWLDITVPGEKPVLGHLHPLTQVRRKVEEIFQSMGFSVVEGPEMETEWYNFDALNIPQEHPARDLWDTLWLKPQNQKSKIKSRASRQRGEAGDEYETFSDHQKSKIINFAQLLKMINNIPGDFLIRFIAPHPADFTDELIEVMAKSEKIAKYLNLPVQSGDNEILKKMNRPYTVQQYKNLVKKIREKIPDINLSTDVIVGFPGETEKQFQNTVKLFKEIKFNIAYIAKYSPRPGTAAFKLKDNVSHQEKERRWRILNDIILTDRGRAPI